MAPRKNTQPQPSIAPFLLPAAFIAGIAATGFGYPGFAAVWAGVVVVAWTEPGPQMTGKKDASGMPTPAGPGEEKTLRSWRFWSTLKWRVVLPSGSWLPSWPFLSVWFVAVALAAAAAHLPVNLAWFRWVNAATAFVTVASVASARRATVVLDDECPGTRFDTLKAWLATTKAKLVVAVAAVIGAATGQAIRTFVEPQMISLAPFAPDTAIAEPAVVPTMITVTTAGVAAGLVVALTIITVVWSRHSLIHWREVAERRYGWKPRWSALKHDPAPFLIDTKQVGAGRVDLFEAPPSAGAMAFWPIAGSIGPTIGAGGKVAVLEVPDETAEGPIPGTRHPLRFEVVSWDVSQMHSISDPGMQQDEVELRARCAMAWTLEAVGYGRPVLLEVEKISSEDSPATAWASQWAWPAGPSLTEVRSLTGDIAGSFGCDVLIDHRQDVIYFGGLLDPDVEFADENDVTTMHELSVEDEWNDAWAQALKQDANPPSIQHALYEERELADGTVIYRQPFMTRLGIDPGDFRGLEPKLATVKRAAPFVAVCGWPGRGDRRGERHPQAFVIYWSQAPVPSSPERLAPSKASAWVIAGRMNQAFDAARLARPEVVSAQALTEPEGFSHLWAVTLRLYGGVTLADVRAKATKLRGALGTSWMRVAEAVDGCTIYVGAMPDKADLVSPDKDRVRLLGLDWEQAWLDAKVIGVGGRVPELVDTGCLPSNDVVQVLTFDMPPGVDRRRIKGAVEKLRVATSNDFVEVRDADKASSVKLLVSPTNPLSEHVPYDFDYVDTSEGIPFATGVEGEPIEFDPAESPHVLLAGVTGSGKMQPLYTQIPVPASARHPDGWSTLGEIRAGDLVMCPDGTSVAVIGLSETKTDVVCKFMLDDGQVVESGPDHLWKVSVTTGTPADPPDPAVSVVSPGGFLRRVATYTPTGQVATRDDVCRLAGIDAEMFAETVPEALTTGIYDGKPVYPLDESVLLVADRLDVGYGTPARTVLTTTEIMRLLRMTGDKTVSIRVGAPVEGARVDVPEDPYLLGGRLITDAGVAQIPDVYMRSSAAQRSALLHGVIDTAGFSKDHMVHILTRDEKAARMIAELSRSLGTKTVIDPAGGDWDVVFVDPAVELKSRVPEQRWLRIKATGVGGPEPMRCLIIDHPEHMYLTDGFVPTHNSVMAQAFIYGALVKKWSVYVIDPVKGGADFRFAKSRSRAFASDPFEAAAVMRAVYDEVVARKNLNAENGVGSFRELPEGIRPEPILVFIDEFTSLLGKSPVPPQSDDPTMTAERELLEAENQAKVEVGVYAGKVAREARSAGVTLALGTQKLAAKMLDTIPGASDLKDLTLDTMLPVPVSDNHCTGWARNDQLELGEMLFTPDGSTAPIIGFSEVFTGRDVYEVAFDDGQVIKAGAGHLWEVWRTDADVPSPEVITTFDLISDTTASWAVRVPAAVELPPMPVPVLPYVAGVRLGRGRPVLSDHKPKQLGRWAQFTAPRIPVEYLRGSIEQRLGLLGGLVCVAGSVSQSSVTRVVISDARAASDVVEMVRSLGIKARVETDLTGDSANLTVSFIDPDDQTSNDPEFLYITAVTAVPTEPTRCIAVDHPSHLFLAAGFVPTHNTNLARTLLGKASSGDRMSALRAFDDAPPLNGSVPKGRGLWEPLTSSAVVIQTWYETQSVLEEELNKRSEPVPIGGPLDLGPYIRRPDEQGEVTMRLPDADVVFDVDEMSFSLDDLNDGENGTPPASEPVPVAAQDAPVPLPEPTVAQAAIIESDLDDWLGSPAGP